MPRPPPPLLALTRGHGYPDLLGQELRFDLVTEPAHDLARRADEDDIQSRAHLGERRVLGDEAPADPRRVGAAAPQRPLEFLVIEVRAARGAAAAQAHRLIGLPNEHRPLLRLGVQGDRPDPVAVLLVQLAHGPDEPHRRLAPIDHRYPVEHVHRLRLRAC